jgi:organic radical activating enzyme
MIKIVNHFDTIQGEGYYAGRPVHLVRLYGCNLDCEWCDTKYALKGTYRKVSPEELVKEISGHDSYLWTGGEPMLQIDAISDVIKNGDMEGAWHALETNGTILNEELNWFDWVEFSPKNLEMLKKCREYIEDNHNQHLSENSEIKVVTDLKTMAIEMVEHADCLMPLTTGNEFVDLKTARRVWEYCVENRKRYSPRLHIGVDMP